MELVCTENNSNWDLYADEKNYLWSIPSEKGKISGAKSSHFGDKYHIRRLMGQGYFNVENMNFTEYGLRIFSGFHSRLIFDDNEKVRFGVLTF